MYEEFDSEDIDRLIDAIDKLEAENAKLRAVAVAAQKYYSDTNTDVESFYSDELESALAALEEK